MLATLKFLQKSRFYLVPQTRLRTAHTFLLAAAATTFACLAVTAAARPALALEGELGSLRGPLPSPVSPAVQANISSSIVNADATSAAASEHVQSETSQVIDESTGGQSKQSLETVRLQSASDSSLSEAPGAVHAQHNLVDPLLPASIAQSVSRPDEMQQLDLTPIRIPERGAAFSNFDSYKAKMLYRLPARMFFSGVCENSLRLETNVFQTSRKLTWFTAYCLT